MIQSARSRQTAWIARARSINCQVPVHMMDKYLHIIAVNTLLAAFIYEYLCM